MKRVNPRQRQLTLLDCKAKRTRTAQEPCREESDSSSTSGESDTDDSFSTGLAGDRPAVGRGEPLQENYVTVTKPSGATTIIINSVTSAECGESLSQASKSSDGAGANLTLLPGSSKPTSSAQHSSGEPSDIASGVHQLPVQPVVARFPTTQFGTKYRSFNSKWYKTYPWIEYSLMKDAAFCYPCRLFATGHGKGEESFTKVGFRDWKHAMGKRGILVCHDTCLTHKEAMSCWSEFTKNAKLGISVANRLNSARKQQILSNRHYISTVAEVLLFCGRQDVAFRGHLESSTSLNRGNFLEIMKLVGNHDNVVQERLQDGPRNATYTSPEVQNTLLQIMANMVRKTICRNVQKAGMFSLLADETKDCSKREQLAIVLRYVDIEKGITNEHFLTYVEASNLNAESLTGYIVENLQKFNLDPMSIVSQGYDGASVMSGQCSGVQHRLREIAPTAIYIHCYAHTLNLVLVDCVKMIPDAIEFFSLLESLYVFISSTKAHALFMQKQKELYPHKQPYQLQRLSDTRWACRYDAVNAVCYTYDSLLRTLEEIREGPDRNKAVEATGLYFQVKSFKFLISLITFDRVLSCTKSLSDQLQGTQIDLSKAADLVLATESTLKEFRSDKAWNQVYRYAQSIAELHNIEVHSPRQLRQRKAPCRFVDSIILESTGAREPPSTSDEYKVALYYPVLDAFLAELERRFSNKNVEIMRAIQACHPKSEHFLERPHLQPLIDSYFYDERTIEMEAILAKRILEEKGLENISDVLLNLVPLKEAFPTLLKLIQTAMTICVSTAHCERSFSTLKRIKTYLRSTMSEQRLTDLAVLSTERELSGRLSLSAVVDEFAGLDKNRRILLS